LKYLDPATSDPDLPSQILPQAGKTALVLSAGGLFGAYQAGAWKYLSEVSFRPDFIVGASVGALNGWAIAGGCDAVALADLWLDGTLSNVLRRREKPGFRAGFFEHEPLRSLTAGIFSGYRASPNFGLVVVQLPFLRSRLVTGDAVTADHLLATASIPLAMPCVSIGGKTFTDGGLLEDVPLWAAVKMGATRIVAIDGMHFNCPWWYRAGVRPMGLFAPRIKAVRQVPTTIIRPSRPLGDYQEALTWNRARIQAWIDLGYSDARQKLAHLNPVSELAVRG
jgi:predicted acylesterase/phospholipase RssA